MANDNMDTFREALLDELDKLAPDLKNKIIKRYEELLASEQFDRHASTISNMLCSGVSAHQIAQTLGLPANLLKVWINRRLTR